jgi:hypothetical protein
MGRPAMSLYTNNLLFELLVCVSCNRVVIFVLECDSFELSSLELVESSHAGIRFFDLLVSNNMSLASRLLGAF